MDFVALTVVMSLALVGLTASEIYNKSVDKEAIKAGLVQKIDPETKKPIWVKPEGN